MNKPKHILMTGGGTMGPVTPLLALASVWRARDPEVIISWVGTPQGPEREMVRQSKIMFHPLLAPKLSRHQAWKWIFIIPHLALSCLQAFILLKQIKPDIVFTAGGYVSVPVVWMAAILGIPSWVHQLDVVPGLANKIMAPFAQKISVTWEESADSFPKKKTKVVGGIVRPELKRGNAEAFKREFGLDDQKPTVLVTGGGTGAQSINEAMAVIGPELSLRMNIIHLTGKGKMIEGLEESRGSYVTREFFTSEMIDALSAADLVVSRAGMGTILELVALKKPAILIPIMETHQERNAEVLEKLAAVKVIRRMTPQILKQEITRLINDREERKRLSQNIQKALPVTAAERIVGEAMEMIK